MAVRSKLGRWRIGYSGTSCPRCKGFLRHETLKDGPQACPSCRGEFEAVRFDPVQPVVVVPSIAGLGPEGGAPCARHARNQADAACSRCGQFMCALCKIDADGKAYCPSCFERLSSEGSVAGGAMRVKNYAGYAAACLFASYPLWFLGPIPSGLGIYFSLKGIKDKKLRNETDGVVRLYVLMALCILSCLIVIGVFAAVFGAITLSKGK